MMCKIKACQFIDGSVQHKLYTSTKGPTDLPTYSCILFIITAVSDHGPKRNAYGVEILGRGINPYLQVHT